MEIYLDNAATTKPCKAAIDACIFTMTEEYGNPSSLHRRGFLAEKLIDEAKKQIADVISATPQEIVFTSGATEGNNLCIIGTAMANKRRGNKIITTAIEHPSVKETMHYLATQGFNIVEIMPNDNGEYIASDFIQCVDSKTILVSMMMVNNETGLILPVFELAKKVKAINPKIIVHTDAVQAFMKLPIKVKNSGIDLMTFSGHKIYAPKGVGGVYIKRGTRLLPTTYGGGQQNGIRVGTEAVPLICALGGAIKENASKISVMQEHYVMLNGYLRDKLSKIGDISMISSENSAPHILNFSVKGIRSEIMLHFLEKFEIYVSSGSACSKGQKNYVLPALGVDKETSDTALRISFCNDTTTAMLDILVEKLVEGINTLAKA